MDTHTKRTKVLKTGLLILDFNEEIYRPHAAALFSLKVLNIKAK